MSKYYIRLDENNNTVKGFSDDFEKPMDTDICIKENGGRQFELNGVINPPLINSQGIYLFKYINNEVIAKTNDEIQQEINNLPTPEPSLEERNRSDIDYILTMQGL